jgi:outer membrane protein assembly factor BamD (BamD/ComL family)
MRASPLLLIVALAAVPAAEPPAPAGPATAAAVSQADARAARRLVKDAEEKTSLGEPDAAVAILERVLEKYPKTAAAWTARLHLGRLHLAKNEYDKALEHFQRAAARGAGAQAEPNPDAAERVEALFQAGLCQVKLGHSDRSFPSFRAVIETAPGTTWANKAYFEIGEAHFASGNYTQAIANYRLVGASLSAEQAASLVAELGRPLVVRIQDRDLLLLNDAPIDGTATSDEGDRERVVLRPLVPGSDIYLAQLPTALGAAAPGDGVLQGSGKASATITYLDRHTGGGAVDQPRALTLAFVGEGRAAITDGAWRDEVKEVILDEGRGELAVRVRDADRDQGAAVERIDVDLVSEQPIPIDEKERQPGGPVVQWQERARLTVSLDESVPARAELTAAAGAIARTSGRSATAAATVGSAAAGMRTGVFTGRVALAKAGTVPTGVLACEVGDRITVRYRDERHLASSGPGGRPAIREASVMIVPGSTATLMVSGTNLRDANLKVRKELLQAETSLRIGNVYRDMGLEQYAIKRFDEALGECRRVGANADSIDRELREQTLHTLWSILLAKGALAEAAEACRTLQREFPDSDLIDDSLLALGEAAEKAGKLDQATSMYQQVAALPGGSTLAPEALFRIGKMHDARIQRSEGGKITEDPAARQRAIAAYRAVFTGFPDSAFAADAVKRIGDLYFAERDYGQAIDFFDRVLRQYPDAPFIDDVLFNLARSRYLKEDFAGALAAVTRLEREHPGYPRLDKARTLRGLVQRRMSQAPAPAAAAAATTPPGASK